MQGFLRADVDLYAEQVLKIFNEPSVVEQTAPRLPGYQQVETQKLKGLKRQLVALTGIEPVFEP